MMTVKELIAILSLVPDDALVYAYGSEGVGAGTEVSYYAGRKGSLVYLQQGRCNGDACFVEAMNLRGDCGDND